MDLVYLHASPYLGTLLCLVTAISVKDGYQSRCAVHAELRVAQCVSQRSWMKRYVDAQTKGMIHLTKPKQHAHTGHWRRGGIQPHDSNLLAI